MNQLSEIIERTDRIYEISRTGDEDFKIGSIKLKIYETQLKIFDSLSRMKYLSQASKFHTPLRASILRWAAQWSDEIAQVYAKFIGAMGEFFNYEYTQATLNLKKESEIEFEIVEIKVASQGLEREIYHLEQELSHLRNKKLILERKNAHQIAGHSNRVASMSLQIPMDKGLMYRLSRALQSLVRRPVQVQTQDVEWQIQNLTRSIRERSGAHGKTPTNNSQEALSRLEQSLRQTLDIVYPSTPECRPVIFPKDRAADPS